MRHARTRREFLEGAVAAAGLASLSGAAPWLTRVAAQPKESITVVLASDASPFEREAAERFKELAGKTLNRDVVVQTQEPKADAPWVSIGATALARARGVTADGLPPEGYRITFAAPGALVVGDRLGNTYGVVRLLEAVNEFRWVIGDERLRQAKPAAAPPPPAPIAGAPAFRIRWIGTTPWSYIHGANVNVSPVAWHMLSAAHTLHRFVPKDQYLGSHPDYFARGSRNRERPHVCTSHPEVIELVVRGAAKALADDPNLYAVTVWPEDGLGFCTCPRCKALDEPGWAPVEDVNRRWDDLPDSARLGSMSRRMTVFYARVGEGLQRLAPGRKALVGAYNAYLLPPRDRSIRIPDNLIVSVTHGKCHNHAFEDTACPHNAMRRSALETWKQLYRETSIYEYYYKHSNVNLPYPILHSIRRDIPFFHRLGVRHLYSQYGETYYVNGANYYLALKLLWDAGADADRILGDFYTSLYGKAADIMREYWNAFEQAAIASGLHTPWSFREMRQIFSDALLTQQDGRLAAARQAGTDAAVSEVLRRTEIGQNYTRMMMRYIDELGRASARQGGGSSEALNRQVGEIKSLIASARGLGVIPKTPAYYLDRALEPERAVRRYHKSGEDD